MSAGLELSCLRGLFPSCCHVVMCISELLFMSIKIHDVARALLAYVIITS